jgi:PAS domain S-box-containing protein
LRISVISHLAAIGRGIRIMSGGYAYTPSIWPTACTILFLIGLAVYAGRRRSVPGAVPFMVACLFTALIATNLLMTYLAVDPETKIFWFRLVAASLLPSSTAITCFILEYAWPGRWLTRRNLILLSILPLLGIFYFLTAGYLTQPMPDFQVGETVKARISLASAIFLAYMLALTLVNLIVFAWLFIRSPRHRWPVALMAASQIGMRVVLFGEWPLIGAQVYTVPVFALPFLSYAIALFGFRILDPIPLARQTAIDQLDAGMLVLDLEGRVANLNPSAERILGVPANRARGQRIQELLPAYPDEALAKPDRVEMQFTLSAGQIRRFYMLSTSMLKDFRGMEVGHLLLLQDVTELKLAQAQIVEQSRVMATQNERERVARELHDSLGQVLSYASFQVETAAKLSRDGQAVAAAEQLDRLGSVVRGAHADLREVILNLHSTASLQQPFFTVVRQYLDAFTSSHDIQTHLNVDPGLAQESCAPETQLQLFRILQEALSNARKHGQAHQVQVTFAVEDGRFCMSIQDDGRGFDPDHVSKTGGSHFGLQFMRERAVEMEGSLQVQSAPGEGTTVVLEFPVNR